MASGITNKGKVWILEIAFRNQMNAGSTTTDMYVALITDTSTPDEDTDVWSDLSSNQIANGNGYTHGGGGADAATDGTLTRNTTDFDVKISDADANTNNYGYIQVRNVQWAAAGGAIPASGDPASYAILMDNAGGSANHANNKVIAWWDLGGQRTVSNGQTLSLQDLELRLT